MMEIIKPNRLKSGDTLGIVATSTPISISCEDTIQRCYKKLHGLGFKTIEAENCRKMTGHTAGSTKERLNALHDFFSNPNINGILSFWGGYQSHQLLENLDYNLIKKNPKPFIGYSDSTALQLGLFSQIGLITYSGPAGITFGKPTLADFTISHFKKALMEKSRSFYIEESLEFSENHWFKDGSEEMKFKKNPGWSIYRDGVASGRVIAGNLGTMLLLAGTKYFPDLTDAILFIEDDEEEKTQTIDRYFTQMRQMGVFKKISALVIGRFHSDVGFSKKDSLKMILGEALKDTNFPVITGIDYGHTDPLITIPIGSNCELNTLEKKIKFLNS